MLLFIYEYTRYHITEDINIHMSLRLEDLKMQATVRFALGKVALGNVLFRAFLFYPVSIIPPWIHIHPSTTGDI
jgi:hypothetical protein